MHVDGRLHVRSVPMICLSGRCLSLLSGLVGTSRHDAGAKIVATCFSSDDDGP